MVFFLQFFTSNTTKIPAKIPAKQAIPAGTRTGTGTKSPNLGRALVGEILEEESMHLGLTAIVPSRGICCRKSSRTHFSVKCELKKPSTVTAKQPFWHWPVASLKPIPRHKKVQALKNLAGSNPAHQCFVAMNVRMNWLN